MIVLDYFYWWYGAGFIRLLKYLKAFIVILADNFSIRIILRTYFQPWKRDVTSSEGLSLDRKLQVWLWNLISRGFGMIIKGFVFIIFLAAFLVLLAVEILVIIIWLFYPIIVLGGLGYIVYYMFK